MALENGEAGARYHAVAAEGVAMRDVAEWRFRPTRHDRSCRLRSADAPTTRLEPHWPGSADRPAKYGLRRGLESGRFASSAQRDHGQSWRPGKCIQACFAAASEAVMSVGWLASDAAPASAEMSRIFTPSATHPG
jgi:hypothetical protein